MEGETQYKIPQEAVEAWLEKTRQEGAQRIKMPLGLILNETGLANTQSEIKQDLTPISPFPDPKNPQDDPFSLKNDPNQIIIKEPYPSIKKEPPENIIPNPNVPPKKITHSNL